jgi:hypothetical protein
MNEEKRTLELDRDVAELLESARPGGLGRMAVRIRELSAAATSFMEARIEARGKVDAGILCAKSREVDHASYDALARIGGIISNLDAVIGGAALSLQHQTIEINERNRQWAERQKAEQQSEEGISDE